MTEFNPYFEEVMAFRHTLSPETDRGCALMAAAYLDDQLARLMEAICVDDKTVGDLLSASGPLASFSAKIDACFALGLIPPMVRRDLHLIRRIRNEFAHNAEVVTFEDQNIANRCGELHYAGMVVTKRTRAKFTNATLGVCAVIHSQLHSAAHATIPPDFPYSDEQKEALRELVESAHDMAKELGVPDTLRALMASGSLDAIFQDEREDTDARSDA